MKKFKIQVSRLLMVVLAILLFSNVIVAQTDTTQVQQNTDIVQTDTTQVQQTTEVIQENQPKEKKIKKKKDEFKIFGGVSINQLNNETNAATGYSLGASYKRGKFLYWELGGRYNHREFDVSSFTDSPSGDDASIAISSFDVPISFGVNILSIVSRIVGLRAFVSAVPSFIVGTTTIPKDDLNTFNMYGQGGIGVDVLFLFVETGYNYGFKNVYATNTKSNPSQFFVNLGFRF